MEGWGAGWGHGDYGGCVDASGTASRARQGRGEGARMARRAAPVERWIVEEALPADRGAGLLHIGPHHCATGARCLRWRKTAAWRRTASTVSLRMCAGTPTGGVGMPGVDRHEKERIYPKEARQQLQLAMIVVFLHNPAQQIGHR
jgi:hypothetical protein